MIGVLLLLALPTCIITGDKCGPHQVEIGGYHTFCACEPGWVVADDGHGCTACGQNEEVVSERCVCKAGYVRASADAECEQASIGEACDTEAACSEPYSYCVGLESGSGYCTTSDCTTDADCPTRWSCEIRHDPPYCRRPPTGLGLSCSVDADCAGYEADYCEVFSTHSCVLAGCAEGDVSCPASWTCCDYSGLLGSALSLCLSPDMLTSGDCPSGGKRSTR